MTRCLCDTHDQLQAHLANFILRRGQQSTGLSACPSSPATSPAGSRHSAVLRPATTSAKQGHRSQTESSQIRSARCRRLNTEVRKFRRPNSPGECRRLLVATHLVHYPPTAQRPRSLHAVRQGLGKWRGACGRVCFSRNASDIPGGHCRFEGRFSARRITRSLLGRIRQPMTVPTGKCSLAAGQGNAPSASVGRTHGPARTAAEVTTVGVRAQVLSKTCPSARYLHGGKGVTVLLSWRPSAFGGPASIPLKIP
jgi:hypothetical protein